VKLRHFGRTGYRISPLSIGAMRLPGDEEEAVKLLRLAIDKGGNYIDTSRGYGDSEIKVGKALKDGYRDKVILSTKWSPWVQKVEESDAPTADCTRKRLEESMRRLDVDVLDFYQVWSIMNPDHFEQARAKGGMIEGIRRAMDEGLVRHIGFTTHDTPENVVKMLETGLCETVTVSFHMFDRRIEDAIARADKLGIGVVIMNPVGGGLFGETTPALAALSPREGLSAAALAVRYVLDTPGVSTAISGFSKTSDVEENFAAAGLPRFSSEERALLEKSVVALTTGDVGWCTGCRYCMPCPEGVDIPTIMRALFLHEALGLKQRARDAYNRLVPRSEESAGTRADACTQCGQCEEKCTQKLAIRDGMKRAQEIFADLEPPGEK